jgi:homoserine dehydrogenase
MELKIALLGFGNVNRALARLMMRKTEALQADFGLTLRTVGISTNSHGAAIDPRGSIWRRRWTPTPPGAAWTN